MANNVKSAAQLKKGANQEIKVINNNPGYIFRHLNKIAQGKDKDAAQVDGYSREDIKELFSRLNSTFVDGAGFWWSSIYAIAGRPVVSLSALSDSTAYYLDPSFCPDSNHVLLHFAGVYYVGRLGEWSDKAVIDAAAARLQLVEKYAEAMDKEEERKANNSEERKEERRAERKAKAKERKAKAERAKEFAETIQTLKKAVEEGTMSSVDAAAKVFELMAA